MFHKILRQLVQPVVGRDHFVVLPKQLLQQGDLVRVEFGFLDLGGNAVVQVEPGNAQLLAPVLVNELYGGWSSSERLKS